MVFEKHLELKNNHAIFSPSQSAWLRYDSNKIINKYNNQYRTALGTDMHEFAAIQITLGNKYHSIKEITKSLKNYVYIKHNSNDNLLDFIDLEPNKLCAGFLNSLNHMPEYVLKTLKKYINDCIDFEMVVEQPLLYDNTCYGTADAIKYYDNALIISDLKTGDNDVKFDQLEIYASLFCLEYKKKPNDLDIMLRIYQKGNVKEHIPNKKRIKDIMNKIKTIPNIINGGINDDR